ncbi:MAG: NAD(+) synthase [Bowdeniella nasicola]|nr:NAD(+) synthase [Bowdeniella nasicola]
MTSVRIALAQVHPVVGDFSANAHAILAAARAASAENADLVIFPTGALAGPALRDLEYRHDFADALADATLELAERAASLEHAPMLILHEPALGDGFVQLLDGQMGVSDGVLETDAGSLTLRAGAESAVPAIDPDHIAVIVLDQSPFWTGHETEREHLLASLTLTSGLPVLYTNLVGGADAYVYDGGAQARDGWGHLVGRAEDFAPEVLIVDVYSDGQVICAADPAPLAPLAERIYRALVVGLRDYLAANGFTRVALGLSGGIDSALVATIAADAIGGANVIGVSMPSRYSSEHSRSDAELSAERIGADYRVQEIAPMFAAFETEMDLSGVAEENLQARIRGQILMAISNSEGPLVLATGNRTEVAVGYSTIYGDSVGGFAPIADVPKTLVWELARWRNAHAAERGEAKPIPENSITKPPSAELRPDQKDSDSLPDYPVLDAILAGFIDEGKSREQLLRDGFEGETVDRVIALVRGAEWKRGQLALGPKISRVTFGIDRNVPVVNAFTFRSEQ